MKTFKLIAHQKHFSGEIFVCLYSAIDDA
jgi:hypothetical protein